MKTTTPKKQAVTTIVINSDLAKSLRAQAKKPGISLRLMCHILLKDAAEALEREEKIIVANG